MRTIALTQDVAQEQVKLPAKYQAARNALAAAVSIDEVKDYRDIAEAMRVYAFQARDPVLAADATDLKGRATRQIGLLMEVQRQAGRMARGTQGRGRPKIGGSENNPPIKEVTLAEQGIDKHLADQARRMANLSEEKFETELRKRKRIAVAAAEGNRAILRAAKAELHAEKRERRALRERELAAKIKALPDKRYGVIYADPEWKFETYSEEGKLATSAEMHYPTSDLEAIKARDVASIAAPDCVLFLWGTVPMTPQALEVMAAWGFRFITSFVWIKDKAGTGYWNRNRHEMLFVGVKGNVPAPAPGMQWDSVIEAPVGQHSEKPELSLELIEAYFPSLPKIELNRRGPARPGWDAWGNEVAEVAA